MPADVNSSPSAPGLQQRVNELAAELHQRTRDLEEAQKYQAAASEVIRLISRSTFDLAPMLQTLADTAMRLCGADMCILLRREGNAYRPVTAAGATPELLKDARDYQQHQEAHLLGPGRGSVTGRVALAKQVVQIADVAADPEYTLTAATTLGKIRTQLGVPLLRDGMLIGVITLSRQKVERFGEQQIKLAQTFADQAVIAIENARLLSEQREALERQTATAEVLQVINASPGNLQPVFTAMLEKALRLCEAAFGVFWTYDGKHFHASAWAGVPNALEEFVARGLHEVGPGNAHDRALRGEAVIHIEDAAASDSYRGGDPLRRALVDLGGARSLLAISLQKEGVLLGTLTTYRQEVRPFTDKQIALLQNFADQAVIAMENARLLSELRQRTDDLTESLEYQTATSELLEVISRSTTDVQPVLDNMLASAARLCGTNSGGVAIRRGAGMSYVASFGQTAEFDQMWRTHEFMPGEATVTGRVLLTRQVVHVADMAEDLDHSLMESVTLGGMRTALGVPLLREGEPIGVIMLNRDRVEPFTDRQIALVRTFAEVLLRNDHHSCP